MPNVLQIPPSELFALLAAIGFAAGLNLYATVAVLGLLARFGHLPLPPGLQLLAGWPVIAASIALFALEFFADKIPAFDLIWNALHTFIRVPVAGLLAYRGNAPAFSRSTNCWPRCWEQPSPWPPTAARRRPAPPSRPRPNRSRISR